MSAPDLFGDVFGGTGGVFGHVFSSPAVPANPPDLFGQVFGGTGGVFQSVFSASSPTPPPVSTGGGYGGPLGNYIPRWGQKKSTTSDFPLLVELFGADLALIFEDEFALN